MYGLKSVFLFTLTVLISSFSKAQTSTQDSIFQLYNRYTQLSRQAQQVDSMSNTLMALRTQYQNFDAILKSNNESLKRITNAQLFTFDRTLKQQRAKIVNTVDFIRSANTSLNALPFQR